MGSWSSRSGQAYDPNKRYVHHSDRRGHSSEIRLKVPPQVSTQIGELVASKIIPEYRRSSDFVADAVVHHLAKIGREIDDGTIQRTLNVVVMLDDATRMERERETFEELIRKINSNAGAFYPSPSGNKPPQWDRLEEYCQELITAVGAIPAEMRSEYMDTVEMHLKAAGGSRA